MRGFAITTPTTTAEKVLLSNPCKFRGKTIEILSVLSNSGGMTTREISNLTGINVDVIGKYCRNGFKRGVFERKEQWGWKATPFGFFIMSINNNNTTESNRNYIGNKSVTNRKHIGIELSTVPLNPHQLTLAPWQSRRTEFEVVVVEYLLEHFQETGSKWMWKDDINPEKIGIPPAELDIAILKLLSEKILFKFKDPHFNLLKFGLTDFFLKGYHYI